MPLALAHLNFMINKLVTVASKREISLPFEVALNKRVMDSHFNIHIPLECSSSMVGLLYKEIVYLDSNPGIFLSQPLTFK